MDRQKNEVVVPELAAELTSLYKSTGNATNQIAKILTATKNRVQDVGDNTATAVTAGMALNFAAVLIQPLVSGIFAVSIDFQYSGATAAAASSFAVTTQSSVGAITLANAAAAGNATPTGANPQVAAGPPGAFVSSAAGGITVSAGGGGSVAQGGYTWTTATGQTTGAVSWNNIVQNGNAGGAAFAPFALNGFVVVLFSINSGTSAMTIAKLCITVQEQVA